MTPDDLMLFDRKQSNRILLVDYKEVNSQFNEPSSKSTRDVENHEIILFNVPKALPTSELITFGVLKGLFYNTEEKAK